MLWFLQIEVYILIKRWYLILTSWINTTCLYILLWPYWYIYVYSLLNTIACQRRLNNITMNYASGKIMFFWEQAKNILPQLIFHCVWHCNHSGTKLSHWLSHSFFQTSVLWYWGLWLIFRRSRHVTVHYSHPNGRTFNWKKLIILYKV